MIVLYSVRWLSGCEKCGDSALLRVGGVALVAVAVLVRMSVGKFLTDPLKKAVGPKLQGYS